MPIRFTLKHLNLFILALIIATAGCGLVYVSVQQVLRQSANDPQIQLAEDAAAFLSAGGNPQAIVGSNTVDVATSLAVYGVIYDATGHPIAASAKLHNKTPQIPAGIFDYVKKYGEDRVTWQPEPGVRGAIVVVPYSGSAAGFVMVGRNLREVERRSAEMLVLASLAWAATVVSTFLALCIRPASMM